MKYTIYVLQYVLTLFVVVTLVFLLPIYLHASEVSENKGGTNDNVVIIVIKNYKFQPDQIDIKPGTIVRWINKEKRQYHSVWFKSLNEAEPDYFFPDESYQRKFESAGSFPYRCGPHPEMTGGVNVKF